MSTAEASENRGVASIVRAQEFFCAQCGYGIVVPRDPPACPMCRGVSWRERPDVARWN